MFRHWNRCLRFVFISWLCSCALKRDSRAVYGGRLLQSIIGLKAKSPVSSSFYSFIVLHKDSDLWSLFHGSTVKLVVPLFLSLTHLATLWQTTSYFSVCTAFYAAKGQEFTYPDIYEWCTLEGRSIPVYWKGMPKPTLQMCLLCNRLGAAVTTITCTSSCNTT
jgi:hypothetical protein